MTIDEFLVRFEADHAADFKVFDDENIRHKTTYLCPLETMAGHTESDNDWWDAADAAKKLGLDESSTETLVFASDVTNPYDKVSVLKVRAKLIAAIESAQSAHGETQ